MKTSILLFLAAAVCISCCHDDDGDPQDANLLGSWDLTNVRGGFAGIDNDFDAGTITWTFHADNTVSVMNGAPDELGEDLFETGTYDYLIGAPENGADCVRTITVDVLNLGCMSIDGQTLTLSQETSDGFTLTLERH